MIGKTLGHYQIVEKIGAGGMGVVYKARGTHLNRFVAIKVLPAEKVADPARKRRFVQEAKAASALNQPNIVTIHENDALDGTDVIVMEHVEGTPLDRLIASPTIRRAPGGPRSEGEGGLPAPGYRGSGERFGPAVGQIARSSRGASPPTIEEIRVISNEDNAGHTLFLYTMPLKPAQK